jgi:hypothetical protein
MADYKTIHGVNLRDYTTDPDTLIEGQVWYDKTNKVVQFFHNNATTAGSWRTGNDLTTERTKLHYTLDDWKHTWMGQLGDNVIFISAIEKSNIEELKKLLYSKVREIHVTRFPYNNFLYPEVN